LKISKKGQGIAIDFLFAVLIFLAMLNASIMLIDSNNKTVSDKTVLNQLNANAEQTIDMLVRTDGMPNDWEMKGIDEITLVGLAKGDRVLEEEKVEKFVQLAATHSSIDYNKLKSRLLIGYDYYFKITDSGGSILKETGQPSQMLRDKMTAASVKRIVNFNGDEVIAEFTVYYPSR